MTSSEHELAVVEKAKAYQLDEALLLCISGEKPNGCHVLDLELSPADVEPPIFVATWHMPPNVRCTPEPMPYEYQETFQIGGRRETVTLHHAQGDISVQVEALPGAESPATHEAVGFSGNWDFTEAFRDAVAKIPTPDIPDWRATYTVVEIGAEVGGLMPVNHLFVRVRGG